MEKREILNFLIFIGIFFVLTSFVSAEILIDQPNSLYNLGDEFSLKFSISQTVAKNGFVSANLVCAGEESEIYKSALGVKSGENKDVTVDAKLDKFIVGNSTGDCYVRVEYVGESRQSQTFRISDDIKVNVNKQGFAYDPGSTLSISSDAIKDNGQKVNGFYEVNVEGMGIKNSGEVVDGIFNHTFNIPGNTESKLYKVSVKVYDKDDFDGINNEGVTEFDLKINQIINTFDIAVDQTNIVPGNNLSFSVAVKDQTGKEMDKQTNIKITSPEGNVYLDQLISSNKVLYFQINGNYTPGRWAISSKLDGQEIGKDFTVEEFKKASFSFDNGTLVVTNIGNVPFQSIIEISIGGVNKTQEIMLDVGQSQKFKLSAPQGVYDIEVRDDENTAKFENAMLTGRAIDVKDLTNSSFNQILLIFLWVVIILLLLSAAVYYYRRVRRKNYLAGVPNITRESRPVQISRVLPNMPSGSIQRKEDMISQGVKENCFVVNLNIKNYDQLANSASNAIDSIHSALASVKGKGRLSLKKGENSSIVFSPSITGEKDNSFISVKAAEELRELLIEHNQNYSSKIEFGIAVHVGGMIIENEENALRFVSLGNTINQVRKLSSIAKQDVLISKEVHSKTISKVKTDREGDYYKVRRIVDNRNFKFKDRFNK